MSFNKLIAKVRQAEDSLEAQERRLSADVRQFKTSWRSIWTPGRIMLAGLAGGFATGRSDREGAANASSVLRILSAASGMLATAKARAAADEAEHAADSAEDAADAVDPGVDEHHPTSPGEPRAAEPVAPQ